MALAVTTVHSTSMMNASCNSLYANYQNKTSYRTYQNITGKHVLDKQTQEHVKEERLHDECLGHQALAPPCSL